MKKFPNKVIEEAYHSALGKVFHKRTDTNFYVDGDGNMDYKHAGMQWLEDHGILEKKFNFEKLVCEYRIVK